MSTPLHNHTWQGVQTVPAVWDKSGSYAGNGWSVELPQNAGNDRNTFAASVQGSNVQLHGLTAKHGFRAFNIRHPAGQMLSDVLLDHCQAIGAGVPGSAPGTGGQGFYSDHLTRLTLQDCSSQDAAGHGMYLAGTIHTARIIRAHLSSQGAHNSLFQLNSQDGSGIFDVTIEDSVFQVRDAHVPVANLLGAGVKDKPIVIRGCKFLGGTPLSIHIDAAPLTANRPSYIRFEDTQVEHTVFISAGSVLWLAGLSKSVRVQGPGKVIRV